MKIAIVSFYFMETTIPLAKHLADNNTRVDMYSLLPSSHQNTYVYDLLNNPQPNGFVKSKIISQRLGTKLIDYLSKVNIKIFIFPEKRFERLFCLDLLFALKLAFHIKKQNYDVIHLIQSTKRFWPFLFFFLNKKIVVQTLHEVTSHHGKTSKSNHRRLNKLIKYSIPVIFHSNVSKERYIKYWKENMPHILVKNNTEMIRFGLFETYYTFVKDNVERDQTFIKILNFGRINAYKGIGLLTDAVEILQKKYPIHLTIAGNGKPYFSFENINHYNFINRFITNEEVVKLIQESDIIVLPYLSASQSGVPMTVFCFNKPIVASNLPGFEEVIDHMETGILVKDLNAETLASSIEILLNRPDFRKKMEQKIEYKYKHGEFSWSNIARQTLNFYNRNIIKMDYIKS